MSNDDLAVTLAILRSIAAGVFLRFPGQWEDGVWTSSSLQSGSYYNVNRWYQTSAGRYHEKDPLLAEEALSYSYSFNNPVNASDPLGLLCTNTPTSVQELGSRAALLHRLGGHREELFNLAWYHAECDKCQKVSNPTVSPDEFLKRARPDLIQLAHPQIEFAKETKNPPKDSVDFGVSFGSTYFYKMEHDPTLLRFRALARHFRVCWECL